MTAKTDTPESVAAQLAEIMRQTEALRAHKDAIEAAGKDAERASRLAHYTAALGPRATEYRDHRDALKNRLDELAQADQLDVPALLDVFLKVKTADAQCSAMNSHASMMNTIAPFGPNEYGVYNRQHRAMCAEIYINLTWSAYLDHIIAVRADAERLRHQDELQKQEWAETKAAGEAARTAAAAQNHRSEP